ncbi:MAG: PKD repeat protein, partial [Sphingobacteriales bacterium]
QSSAGTEFYLTFLTNSSSLITLSVNISAITNAKVILTGPGFLETVNVVPNSTTRVDIPKTVAYGSGGTTKSNKVLKIISDNEITVVASNSAYATGDASLVLPRAVLSQEYIVTTYSENDNVSSNFSVISLENNTTVEITPSVKTSEGNAAGVPFSVVLNKGVKYGVHAGNEGADLTGTRVKALSSNPDKKIAVFAGVPCTNVGGCTACDHLFEQVLPVESFGRTYATVPFQTRLGDLVRILSAKDNNKVNVNGTIWTLNTAEYRDTVLNFATYIESTKPIQVTQYSRGASCDGTAVNNADPFMLNLSSLQQLTPNKQPYSFTFDANSATDNVTTYYVNILCKTENKALVKLDGAAIVTPGPLGDPFTALPNNADYSYVQVSISPGTHNLSSDSGLLASIYGFGNYESYGYIAASNLLSLNVNFDIIQSNCLSFPVEFVPNLVGFEPVSYQWDFGDATASALASPTHTYSSGGDYLVKLILESQFGIDTVSKFITIAAADSIVLMASNDTTICSGDFLELFAEGGTHFDWAPTTGLIRATSPMPEFVGNTSQTYLLTAFDSICTDTAIKQITINVKPLPKASFTYELNDKTVKLTAKNINVDDSFIWDFGDRSPLKNNSSETHTFTQNGIYNVILIVLNSCGSDTVTLQLIVDGRVDSGSTSIQNRRVSNYTIFPNPAEDIITITQIGNQVLQTILIFDLQGTIVDEINLDKFNISISGNTEVPLNPQLKGLHIIQLRSNFGVQTNTLLIN